MAGFVYFKDCLQDKLNCKPDGNIRAKYLSFFSYINQKPPYLKCISSG